MRLVTIDANEEPEIIVRFTNNGKPSNAIKLTCQPEANTIGASPLSPNRLTITGIKKIAQFKEDSFLLDPFLNKKQLGMFVITRMEQGKKSEPEETEDNSGRPDAKDEPVAERSGGDDGSSDVGSTSDGQEGDSTDTPTES